MSLHIVVFAKVVPDYEVPASDFELTEGRAHKRYTRMIGLYDENAIELGVQLKEKYSAQLTIISYGIEDDISVLRKALAMGGDKLVLVTGASDDPNVIAENLKMALNQIDEVDLILAGRQSADLDRGVVPGMMAEKLGFIYIPQVSNLTRENGGWHVTQITETSIRELRFGGKGVLSITSVPENVPRIPAVRQIFAAKKKGVDKYPEIEAESIGAKEISVEIPVMESECEFLSVEDDPKDTARMLISKLREERVI